MNFGDVFQELCIEHDTNPKQLSKKINISDSLLYKYFQGTLPRIKNAVIIANYFDCSLNFLFGIDNQPKQYIFSKNYNSNLFYPRYVHLLKQNNLTHYNFCKNTKINHSSLHYWKNGVLPYFNILETIATNLNCSIDYLVGRANE